MDPNKIYSTPNPQLQNLPVNEMEKAANACYQKAIATQNDGGKPEEVIKYLKAGLSQCPGHLPSLKKLGEIVYHNNLLINHGALNLTPPSEYKTTLLFLHQAAKKAIEYAKEGDRTYLNAAALYLDSSLKEPALFLGELHHASENYEAAIPFLQHAMIQDAVPGNTNYLLASALLHVGRTNEAKNYIEQALHPTLSLTNIPLIMKTGASVGFDWEKSKLYTLLAKVYKEEGNLLMQLKNLHEALVCHQGNGDAHLELCNFYLPKINLAENPEQLDKAIKQVLHHFKEYLRAEGKNIPNDITLLLQLSNKIAETSPGIANICAKYALEWYTVNHPTANYANDPFIQQYVNGCMERVELAMDMENFDQAILLCKEAQKYAPTHPVIIFQLGIANSSLENYEEAIHLFKDLIEKLPNNPIQMPPAFLANVQYFLGANQLAKGDFLEAAATFSNITTPLATPWARLLVKTVNKFFEDMGSEKVKLDVLNLCYKLINHADSPIKVKMICRLISSIVYDDDFYAKMAAKKPEELEGNETEILNHLKGTIKSLSD